MLNPFKDNSFECFTYYVLYVCYLYLFTNYVLYVCYLYLFTYYVLYVCYLYLEANVITSIFFNFITLTYNMILTLHF